jgi:hypothetical protein
MTTNEIARGLLFGETDTTKCDFPALSKRTGIPESTLRRYKENPETIPFGRVVKIAQAMRINKEGALVLISGGNDL